MVKKRVRWSPLAIIFSLALIFTSLAPIAGVSAQDQPVQGGTLQTSLGEEPDQLDPARTIELTAYQVNTYIYDQLVYIGADGLPSPWVAESWEISPDNLTITIQDPPGHQVPRRHGSRCASHQIWL